ncbi:hypothetical protein VD659_16400 [Herbiconiux sp. 11R-BC]
MMILLVVLGIAAVVGIVGTILSVRQDGYRKVPERPAERRDHTPGR